MKDIGARLKKAMEIKGVTPYEVAKSTGIAQTTLSRILNGTTKKPNMDNLKTLASFLQVSDDWLRTGEGEMNRTDPGDTDGSKTEITVKCDEKMISKFASAIESIAKSNSTMSDTNKILAENNAELIQQIRKLLHTLYDAQPEYGSSKQSPLHASDKKTRFKP